MLDKSAEKTVTIIGGGLSGLTCALLLNRAGFNVTLVEKKTYPFHRVCGEYVSNEVRPFLKSLEIYIDQFHPSAITRLTISSSAGNCFNTKLDLGGFGLSRFTFDRLLFEKASNNGVKFLTGIKATDIIHLRNQFSVSLSNNSELISSLVISAHGKRSNLDRHRDFFDKRSPYLGVKYHIKTDFPVDLVQLDNFEGGYCGTVKIEADRYNLCYLIKNQALKKHGSIEAMEKEVLFKNPLLRTRFLNSDFLNEKPEVINEISFEQKPLTENGILYCGDSAGMISPLCGNGMAMAIHSAKILSETITEHFPNQESIEKVYQTRWKKLFENRLQEGRFIQRLFGHSLLSEFALKGLNLIPRLSHQIIKRTHGKPF